MAAKIATSNSAYIRGASDFGVLANASKAPFTVTLPPARTAPGMLMFIKKVDTSTHPVILRGVETHVLIDRVE